MAHGRLGKPEYDLWLQPFESLPELQVIGRTHPREATSCDLKSHPSVLEVIYVQRGQIAWWVGPELYHMHGGEMAVIFPGEEHGGLDGVFHPSKLYWLWVTFPPAVDRKWLELPYTEARELNSALETIGPRSFSAPPSLSSFFKDVIGATRRPQKPLLTTLIRSRMVSLLVDIVRYSRLHRRKSRIGPKVARAVSLMHKNLTEPVSIPDIAQSVGWSVSHFKRQFGKALGVSPGAYYLQQRIAAARETLCHSDEPVTSIAHKYGFSSSQYMADCFRRVVGRTPCSYRQGERKDDERSSARRSTNRSEAMGNDLVLSTWRRPEDVSG